MFAIPLTENAELRTLDPWHAEEFAANLDRCRESIRPWVGAAFVAEGVDGARATLTRYAEARAKDAARLYGIWRDGTLVGGVLFVSLSVKTGVCEIGCWLEPAAEGNGLVTRACRELLDWAFGERGMHRAEWHCRADNAKSAAVAERLGMTLEGTTRESWPFDGARYDSQIWGVLTSEWKKP
ncbi:GNAT family N-acetyltransferase [Phytomonospora endophytica]|uniref:RimJ/RimL family protein N-acetyltransferase n=1 Tax=Phytomonospora endophytica TaxID=714109 RepID=A0A841F905_9ACTN|nr:GNAT family protein [Phytomonospora endophytica]MBB6032234.1 RimJ/RimL family protein N-acetyltransferase [Phytomonospora endophytica]GIG68583.1 N-acetyltransferase [Phytomonospora endophytica]